MYDTNISIELQNTIASVMNRYQ